MKNVRGFPGLYEVFSFRNNEKVSLRDLVRAGAIPDRQLVDRDYYGRDVARHDGYTSLCVPALAMSTSKLGVGVELLMRAVLSQDTDRSHTTSSTNNTGTLLDL